MSVCRAWQRHLSQPGALWEAAVLTLDHFNQGMYLPGSLRRFTSQRKWLLRHGQRLRQFHFSDTSQSPVCEFVWHSLL